MEQKEKNEKEMADIPVDEGWAWVIVIGCTTVYFLYVGVLKSFGLFFVEYLEVFGASVSMTSLISGIQTAMYSIVSWPLLIVGLRFISVRQSVMIGAFLCALSYGLSSLATSIEFLVITQSVIFGAGAGFLYSPNLILLGKYFDKRRGLANGITIAGCSLGSLVFPPLFSYILFTYGLYGAMVITSGILLNLFVGAFLLRPPSFYKSRGQLTEKPSHISSNPKIVSYLSEESGKSASQPMLVPESPTFVRAEIHRQKRFRTLSERPQLKTDDNSETFLDRLSNSNLIRYLSNGNITSQSFIDIGNTDIHNESPSSEKCCAKSKTFFCDTSLFTCLPYILNTCGYCFGSAAAGIGYVFIPSFAVEQGIDVQKTALLLSIIGAADFLGRLLSGYFADRQWIRKQYIVAISQGIVSLLMHLSRFYTDLWSFAIFCGIFGLFAGTIISLNPTIMIDITGIDRFASGIAIYSFVTGVSLTITTPFLGFLRDCTGNYYMTFHYFGITSFVAMLIYVLMPLVMKASDKKKVPVDLDV